jgi:predicted nucleic acid-binding Zn ribbon protein
LGQPVTNKNKNKLYYKIMDDILKPKINLKEQPTVECEKCHSKYFKEVVMLKKISKILTGSPEDTIVPFPTYMCNECGNINSDFELFD